MSNRCQIIEQLRKRVEDLETNHHSLGEIVSTGCQDLDELIGYGRLQQGSLVEWIGSPGSGATTLALMAAKSVCRERKILVVVDHRNQFYPPAAQALGVDLTRTIVVQPKSVQDFHWSLNQILRSRGVATVVGWPDKANEKMLRRWQLATEQGKTLGFLVRPLAALKEPTWAKVRLLVEARSSPDRMRRWRITVLGSLGDHSIELEMDDETGKLQKARALPVAAALVNTAPLQRSTGA